MELMTILGTEECNVRTKKWFQDIIIATLAVKISLDTTDLY